jgi:antitoxin component YwqK of YwqJK toxin-antitoxin module
MPPKKAKKAKKEVLIDPEQVWVEDWFYIDGSWRRIKKTRTPDGILKYYCDGKLVQEVPYKNIKVLHRKLSGKEVKK